MSAAQEVIMMDACDEPLDCDMCGGILWLLGVLGNLAHLSCRDCGAQSFMNYGELPGCYKEGDDE